MKLLGKFQSLAITAFATLIVSNCLYGFGTAEQAKKRMMGDIDFIENVFDVKYAPKEWKQEFCGWNLENEIATAKAKVLQLHNPTTKQFQHILKEFFNSVKDYHVTVRFFSTERATLPFMVKSANGKYYLTYIDRVKLPKSSFPYEVGDEITRFDGKTIHEAVQDLRLSELGSNTLETDQALAELQLTVRRGDVGDIVPKGPVEVSFKKGNEEKTLKLYWEYVPEQIKDFTKLGNASFEYDSESYRAETARDIFNSSPLFQKMMVCANFDKPSFASASDENPYSLGARKSYLPALGKKMWQTDSDYSFDAYIFTSNSGKKIGYVRIPHYVADEEEAEDFRRIIEYFGKRTEGLVIDQLNNPGGSVFYLYALASMLTDEPLETPKHRMALTQQEVYSAVSMLPLLDLVQDDETAKAVLGDTIGGYPVSYNMVQLMTRFCKFVISEWNSGNIFTKPFYILGVDQINPHPKTTYNKPILILTNALDFSGGDFFPAIMQDNQRATIVGGRTAGAGGYVLSTQFPNHTAIKGFHLTGSLAHRQNQKPIENLGVTPDMLYEVSERDLKENYHDYTQFILNQIEILLKR